MRILCLGLLAGCSAEYQVLLDGEPLESFADAAASARPGSVITLAPERYEGGVTLANGVTIEGNGATIHGDEGPLIVGGDLVLRDLILIGGRSDEGAAVQAETLVMERVEQSGAEGRVAVRSNQALEARDSRFDHDGIALEARSNLGRSRQVTLERVWTSGDLSVEADEAVLVDVEAVQLNTGGWNTRIEQTVVQGAAIRGRAVQAFGLEATLGSIQVDTVALADLTGGTWAIDGDFVQGVGLTAEVLQVDADTAVLAEVTGTDVRVQAETSAELVQVRAPRIQLVAPALTAADVEGEDVTLGGAGLQQDIRAVGTNPRLSATLGTLRSVLLVSEAGPAQLTLDAAEARNLLVTEPADAIGGALITSGSYAVVEQSTFRVGRRTSLASVPVGFGRSVVYGVALGDIVGANTWDDTVVWSETEVLPPRLGLTVADPLFLPSSPELNPLSPWLDHGAFAGPYSVQARWDALE